MEIDSITIKNIRVFISVVELGSVKAAAKKIGVSPATIYSHIKWLEEKLYIKLFWYKMRPDCLTPKGKAFYEIALELTSILDKKIRLLHDLP